MADVEFTIDLTADYTCKQVALTIISFKIRLFLSFFGFKQALDCIASSFEPFSRVFEGTSPIDMGASSYFFDSKQHKEK